MVLLMADGTGIEWCHATINAISGCAPCSPGCTNCYAMRAGAFGRPNHPVNGLTRESKGGHVWTGAVRFNEGWLRKPLAWKKPRRIFWNAHGDPFFEAVPTEWVDQEVAIAALTPQHRHILLSKRSARMRAYFSDPWTPERVLATARHLAFLPERFEWPLPNLWLGVSVEDQARADERVPDLLHTPAEVRLLSCEPLLDELNLACVVDVSAPVGCRRVFDALGGSIIDPRAGRVFGCQRLDWVIVGGESGPRPMDPAWARFLRDQCDANNIPFLFKQWGDWAPYSAIGGIGWKNRTPTYDGYSGPTRGAVLMPKLGYTSHEWEARFGECEPVFKFGKARAGRLLDGKLHDAYPELFEWETREARHG